MAEELKPLRYFTHEIQLQNWIEDNDEVFSEVLEIVTGVENVFLYKREAVLNFIDVPDNQKRVDFWFKGDNADILVETKNPKAVSKDLRQILDYMDLLIQRKEAVYKKATSEEEKEFVKNHKTLGILVAPQITHDLVTIDRYIPDVQVIETSTWTYSKKREYLWQREECLQKLSS